MKRAFVVTSVVAALIMSLASPARASTPGTEPQDPELVALLLTVDDLPIGWAASDDLFSDDQSVPASTTPSGPADPCTTNPLDIDQSLPYASASFTGAGLFDIFGEYIIGLDNTEEADGYVQLVDELMEECPTALSDDTTATTCADMSFPDIGHVTFAMRCTPDELPIPLAVVVASVDDNVIILFGAGEGGEGEFLAEVSAIAADRTTG